MLHLSLQVINKQIKIKTCACGYTGKFFGKKCGVCRQKTYDRNRVYKQLKPTGQKELFLEIWNERDHVSGVSGKPLFGFSFTYFSHVLPKGKNQYPKFKLYKKNIMLKTWEEHELWEHHQYKLKDLPEWQHVFKLKEELINEYNENKND